MAVVRWLRVQPQVQMQMRQPALPDFRPLGREIEEVEEPPAPPAAAERRLFVAVGKDVKECTWTVEYAAKHAGGKTVVLLHVHQPSKTIPMRMGGSFPANRVEPTEVKAHRERERKKMHETLKQYKEICERERVAVDMVVIEMDDVEKGILQLVEEHGITNLVMGAAAHKHLSTCQKIRQPKSRKAVGVGKRSPPACHISFVCKGELICTRKTNGGTSAWVSPPSPAARTSTIDSHPSPSLRSPSMPSRSPRLSNPIQDLFRSKSYNRFPSSHGSMTPSPSVEDRQRKMLESPTTSVSNKPSQIPSTTWSTSNGGASSTSSGSVERDDVSEGGSLTLGIVTEYEEDGTFASLPNESDVEEADLFHAQLDQAMEDAEVYRRKAYEESNRRQKAEKEAIEAARRVRAAESLCNKEMKHRREMEIMLQQEIQRLENIKIQQQEVYDELQRAYNQQLALEADIAGLNCIVTEVEEKLAASKDLLSTAQRERDELQRERDEAVVEAEELRRHNEDAANAPSTSSSSRTLDFSEFGFDELADATCSFHESTIIGQGGYGSVYKGFLRHTLVAVKMPQPQSKQGQREFQQEVNVLRKVRHPNVVTLIGTCPEAGALIYEYLHNGSLEERLTCKDNSPPLPWQTRIQIATDICSALIFLHSNKPDGIVHGDLKPANVLLDANYSAKLGDFGISRSIPQMNSAATLCLETDPKGTVGYMDPDFLCTGELTPGSDVYSFGVIILRLLTGKPAQGIANKVRDALDSRNLHQILDGIAGDWPFIQAKQLAEIGLRCCETNRKSRPDLASEVLRVLQRMTALGMSKELGRVPSYFICPIFLEEMQDPRVAADGFTYEAEAIRGWLDDGHNSSPMTNTRLVNKDLIPNRALKSAIQEWLHQT